MLKDYYNEITSYLLQTLGEQFILLTILLTTAATIGYFVVIVYIVTQLNKEYFIGKIDSAADKKDVLHTTSMNSSLTYVIKIVKIIVGLFLLVCGMLMLVLPGQGLITILISLSLLPFPGKTKLEQQILSRQSVRTSLNWIRIKANKPPFIFE